MAKIFAGLGVVGILTLACLGRYELIGVAAGGEGINGIVYKLDRWTGEVVCIQGSKSVRVELQR